MLFNRRRRASRANKLRPDNFISITWSASLISTFLICLYPVKNQQKVFKRFEDHSLVLSLKKSLTSVLTGLSDSGNLSSQRTFKKQTVYYVAIGVGCFRSTRGLQFYEPSNAISFFLFFLSTRSIPSHVDQKIPFLNSKNVYDFLYQPEWNNFFGL